ncbi:MAG: hypothetical protein ACI9VR_002607 [Cognaticolwellia sp.]|jgi:hypothetical protein
MWSVCLIEQPSFSIQSMSTNQAAIESPEPSVSSPFLAKVLSEVYQQLAHAGYKGHLVGFSTGLEAGIEGFDVVVESGGYQGSHIECGAYPDPAAVDEALAAELT